MENQVKREKLNDINYAILDEITLDKNVDRVKFLKRENKENNLMEDYILSACYHLEKDSGKKVGALNLNQIKIWNNQENKKEFKLSKGIDENLDYGILDVKYTNDYNQENLSSISNSLKLFTSNSDYSFSIFNLNFEKISYEDNSKTSYKTHRPFELISKYKIQNEEYSYNPKETCNALDIKNIQVDSTILLAMNDGCHCIFDLTNEKSISIKKSHDYGLWSCMIKDLNRFFTGSEDSFLKMWDRRTGNKAIGTNRTHTASINCIQNLINDENSNYIITGSYDEIVRIIDIRKFNECVYKKKLDCSIWDFNQQKFKNKNFLFMSCVYEGFNVFEYDVENIILNEGNDADSLIRNVMSFPLRKNDKDNNILNHKTIVYGVDTSYLNKDDELFVTSCSFYDNSINFWKIF